MSDDFIDIKKKTEALKDFPSPWFICGGWAIDLALGYKTREHKDIDIGIFRGDQLQLQKHFSNWRLEKINSADGSMSEWISDEFLELPIHEIKAKKDKQEIEFLLNESDDSNWIFRRDPSITLSKKDLIKYRGKLPYLTPEVSLLYKAKEPKEHDEQDFEAIVDQLSLDAKIWLKQVIERLYPRHKWISILTNN